jgi:prevent-host-death family protein
MMAEWKLREAKARFSDVVKRAMAEGPQRITVHGKPAAVLVSEADYQKLAGEKSDFLVFMQASPLRGIELDLTRDKTPPRDEEL